MTGVLALLAGCGAAQQPNSTGLDCGAKPPAKAKAVARLGDDSLRLIGPGGGRCANALFVKGEPGTVQDDAFTRIAPKLTRAFVLHGQPVTMLVVTHPRGGYQPRLLTPDDGVAEIESGGEPLLPFVATDTNQGYLAASCSKGRIAVLTAAAHEPAGIVPTWDVWRSTYAVKGAEATLLTKRKVSDNVLDVNVEKVHPELVERQFFRNC